MCLNGQIAVTGHSISFFIALSVNTRREAGKKDESISPLKHLNIDQLDREFRTRVRMRVRSSRLPPPK